MTQLKTVIVDDEPLAIKLLKSKLSSIADIDVVAECANGREAIAAVLAHTPDLVFLDIQMPGMNGFEVVKNLQADVLPLIVFVTAYEKYALDAFDLHAVDYVLKPIDAERVERAVQRALTRLHGENIDAIRKESVIGAIDKIAQKVNLDEDSEPEQSTNFSSLGSNSQERKIIVKDRDAIVLLEQKDIEWIDAAGDYMCLHVGGITHIMRSTMKHLLDELDPHMFKRIHRSTIVNLSFIKRIIPHTKGECFLELNEFDRIKVSRNYRDVIQQFLLENPSFK
ncbi:response regulator transcription factor [Endozoicomonas sp. G2_1]|uniref:LytR/AlgR family response regulator transcription factor n=1 Tax=Endozoicomonas sp. G2_1 TaxID=2821091 RepID=UPI001ADA100A|nr:LytTR family DNA-binding domain-containing protein [Endozoicomonas sp. G2_1]MBO9488872.1 response regulator transcription factor [Endozoicomonas sp. G2_1]